MLKIALIAPVPPPYGGISNWVQLISAYVKSNIEDIALVNINTAPKKRQTEGRTLWNRIVVSGLHMFVLFAGIWRAVGKGKVQLFHITTSGQFSVIRDIGMIYIARLKKIPVVYHIRFGRVPQIASERTMEWKLIRYAMKLSSYIIAIDRTTEKMIAEKVSCSKVTYIPNPINIRKPRVVGRQKNKEIVFIGWVIKEKGIEELLAAWEMVYRENADWQLKVIGPVLPEYLEHLRSRFSFYGVCIEGEKEHSEAMNILQKSSIFILPSHTEGFPNSILEAMLFENAVVATNVGAIPDMLDGNCGVCIKKENIREITDSLIKLINYPDIRKEMINNAYKKVITEYALDNVFAQYREIWEKLIYE